MNTSYMFIEDFTSAHLEYRNIFDGNNEFITEKLQEDPLYFEKLSKGQKPKYLIIGCSDSRVPPNDLTKTQPGDIFNHRNIGNQVLLADMNVNSVIQYAVEALQVKHVIVMGHTKCGGMKAAIEGQAHGGILDLWISHIKNVYEKYSLELDDIEDIDDRSNRLSELNVVEQVMNCWKNPYIQKAWTKNKPVWVHGWVFRIETGKLEEIIVNKKVPDLKVFKYQFAREKDRTLSVIDDHHHHDNDTLDHEQNNSSPDQEHDHKQKEEHEETVKLARRVDRLKSQIWLFDDFLNLQSEFMHQQDPTNNHNVQVVIDEMTPIVRKSEQESPIRYPNLGVSDHVEK